MADNSKNPSWLRYANGGAKRNLPINSNLLNAMGFLEGMGIQMEVFSGGQVTKEEAKQGKGRRTGSIRHDHGAAADVRFYQNGRKLDWGNEADVPVFQDIVRQARARGVTGFGAGVDYMEQGSMHIGYGAPGVWGKGGAGENAAGWLRDAFNGVKTADIKPPTRLTFSNPGADQPQSKYTIGDTGNSVNVMDTTQPMLPTTMADERAAAQAREDAVGDVSLWQGVKDAVNTDWSLSAIWQERPEMKPDENFRLDKKLTEELTKGIPDQYWDRFSDAQSLPHAEGMRKSLLNQLEAEKRLASLGWGGVGLRVAAGVTDPLAWAAAAGISVATMGTGAPAAVAARFGKVGQVALAAAEGGAGAAVSEGIIYANKATAEEADLWWGIGTGMLLGGAFGALSKNPATLVEAQQMQKIGRDMQAGTALSSGGSTAGAAQINPREPLRLDTADIVRDAERPDVFHAGGARYDSAYSMKSSENDLTAMIGNVLVEDGARNKSGVTPIGASEVQALLHQRVEARWASSNQANWKQFHDRNPEATRDDFHQQVTAFARDREFAVEYDPAVKAQGAVLRDLLGSYAEQAANPGLIDGRTLRPVRGFEGLTKNDHYVPRIFDLGSIQAHLSEFGHKTLSTLVSRGIREVNDQITEEAADKFARNYIKKLHSLSAGELQQMSRAFSGEDLDALKANLLTDTDLSEVDIDAIVGHLKPGKGDGASRHGKSRAFYNENFGMMLAYSDGKNTGSKFVRISDLFVNDADTLMRAYSRQMSGRIAMARMEIKNPKWQPGDLADEYFVKGITSDGEWGTLMDKVRDVGDQKGIQGKTKADIERMSWAYNTIVGKPSWNEGSNWSQFLRMTRDYNFVRVMGQVGFAQLSESMNLVSQLGLKATFTNVPSFRAFWRNAKTGQLDDALAREWEELTGGGADWARHATHRREDVFDNPLDTMSNPIVDKIDTGLHYGKRAVSAMSGMAPVNTALQRMTGRAIMNKFAHLANGKTTMNPRRLEALGLDAGKAEAVSEAIRKHATFDNGKLKSLNVNKWDDVDAAASFQFAAFRLGRSIIQENDIGQMAMWMSAPLARTFLQFRSFVLAAYTKQTLQGLNFRDTTTAAAFLTTTFAASMAYMMRTYAGSIGRSDREEYLEKRLSLERIAAAGVQNSSWASVMPMAVDSVLLSPLRGAPVFDARNTELGSDAFLGNPSADLLKTGLDGLGVAGKLAHGGRFSQGDARTLARVLPFQNLNGIAQLTSAFIRPLPEWSRDPRRR